jgi:hypothetical protein
LLPEFKKGIWGGLNGMASADNSWVGWLEWGPQLYTCTLVLRAIGDVTCIS